MKLIDAPAVWISRSKGWNNQSALDLFMRLHIFAIIWFQGEMYIDFHATHELEWLHPRHVFIAQLSLSLSSLYRKESKLLTKPLLDELSIFSKEK